MGLDMYLYRNKREEVGYWRKANQIRNWLDKHVGVENTTMTELSKETLEELLNDCKRVLENHILAPLVLPTSSGFFFGSTAYDEWYFDDLEQTVEMLERVIAETDWDSETIEYYEWW